MILQMISQEKIDMAGIDVDLSCPGRTSMKSSTGRKDNTGSSARIVDSQDS